MNLIKKYWLSIVGLFVICMFTKPSLCFLILGSIISYIGIASIIFLQRLKKIGKECTGQVVEYVLDSYGDKTPIIGFTTLNGGKNNGKSSK